MTTDPRPAGVPPYVSFGTLMGQIEKMESSGMPEKVNRSFLAGLSPAYQSQVLNALQFLGLADDTGTPMPRLHDLVSRPGDRPGIMRNLLSRFYPVQVELASVNATHGHLEDAFRRHGLSGDTLRKATMFFLHAAAYSGLPVSPHFRSGRGPNGTTRATPARPPVARKKSVNVDSKPSLTTPIQGALHANSHAKTVALTNGGVVTLSVNVDIFSLSPADREFVLDLVDRVNAFASKLRPDE